MQGIASFISLGNPDCSLLPLAVIFISPKDSFKKYFRSTIYS